MSGPARAMFFPTLLLVALLSSLPGTVVFSQSGLGLPGATAQTAGGAVSASTLPDGFRRIRLGMGLDEVKTLLASDSYFLFRGDPDVSLLLEPNTTLIECRGSFFIERAFFQFHDERLYIIILMMNQERIAHYSLYTTLTEKYGRPTEFSPIKVLWRSGDVELALERPLTVKYLSRRVFEARNAAGEAAENVMETLRDEFLGQF